MAFVNKILKPFGVKLIKTTPVFDWIGGEYKLPLQPAQDLRIRDANGKPFPIRFKNEEDRNLMVRAINRALANES